MTLAITMSPGPAAGSLFSLEPQPHTAMTYRFLAPVLSAQFITAATGRPTAMRNLLPEAPPFFLFAIPMLQLAKQEAEPVVAAGVSASTPVRV